MRHWTTAADLKKNLGRKWAGGRLLAAGPSEEAVFPLRVPIAHPTAGDLSACFEEAREWLRALSRGSKAHTGKGYELEWREINHRQLGRNKMPVAAVFECRTEALAFIGKLGEAEKFSKIRAEITGSFPELGPWLVKRPPRVLEHEEEWPRLLAVLTFLKNHPRPNIYIRQLDLTGVDTKFIERHRKLLSELLDLVLPPEAIRPEAKGAVGFEERYGFTAKPVQIRFRLLDERLYIQGLADLQIPVPDFAALDLPVERVFITENMINGLAFPELPGAMVIFGLGYGLDRLAGINWLQDKKIYYWGDLDSHGFAMLDQVRAYFPAAVSLLMDRTTLLLHRRQWGHEQRPTKRDLPRLRAEEVRLYNEIRDDIYAPALRLEQERINYGHFQNALAELESIK
ncbi:FIG005429: hypothetical protein [hydrothermal vent metagenome]|uniref:Wadjet protein JetD C-terminal domain-containing protein n=1 Tax=hydrothermal vent metagenome TaxID=652676 RepID=A0A3B0UND0_9ZZZZ